MRNLLLLKLFLGSLLVLSGEIKAQDNVNNDKNKESLFVSKSNKDKFLSRSTVGVLGGCVFGFPGNAVTKTVYQQDFQDRVSVMKINNGYGIGNSSSLINRKNFGGGMFFNYQINKRISIQPELLYTSLGYSVRRNIEFYINESGENKISRYSSVQTFCFNYLQLPVLFKYHFLKGNTKAFILGGPVIGIKLAGYVEHQLNDSISNTQGNNVIDELELNGFNTSKRYKKEGYADALDLGVLLGLGVSHDIGRFSLNLEARYYRSFQNDYYIHSSQHMNVGVGQGAIILLAGIGYKL